MDSLWVTLPRPESHGESMADRIRRIDADLRDLGVYYNISIAERRHERLRAFYKDERDSLMAVDFDLLDQQGRVDFLLLRNFLQRRLHQLDLEMKTQEKMMPLLPFAQAIVSLCEGRQDVKPINSEQMAAIFQSIRLQIQSMMQDIGNDKVKIDKAIAYKAAKVIDELRGHLDEFFGFYSTYDPMFDWWVSKPWQDVQAALSQYLPLVQTKLAGMHLDAEDEIVGEPIGRDALLVELEAEMIPYTPEDLIKLAKEQYAWCEKQMKAASNELGYGDDWKRAMDYVKTLSAPTGEHTQMVIELAREGAAFVKDHNLLTVPDIAENTYRMTMMGPEQQKVSPFFLGGDYIQVAWPTVDMSHDLKQMVMRGNNRHFSKATAFHELVPGHRMQFYMSRRSHSHRQLLFMTPFWIEGGAMYWELLFWQRGDFFTSPEDRIGTMFWRMHRCARIIFSLQFHLGRMTPTECIDLLVNWVGHERSTAEGEVRRSFNGDYGPLYQCGYMLGALQLWQLRQEVLESGKLKEKEFHDAILRSNTMPIELMRALLLDKNLSPDYKAGWKFYK